MNREGSREDILKQVDRTLSTYCSGCFLYAQNRKDMGRAKAHQFCLASCTVGEQLKNLGKSLLE
ncbi:zinc-finger domain-containing protein [Bacillus testis]|uniref:zinc-finger domain-containing protein n=1 Tax=Bacillus testis TaxID=1622072 RepID=UPI00067E8976|nr:zinc-finger domain-containing protein [Bacillus testis]